MKQVSLSQYKPLGEIEQIGFDAYKNNKADFSIDVASVNDMINDWCVDSLQNSKSSQNALLSIVKQHFQLDKIPNQNEWSDEMFEYADKLDTAFIEGCRKAGVTEFLTQGIKPNPDVYQISK